MEAYLTVIILGNGHSDTNSNPEKGCFCLTFVLSPSIGK